MNNYVIYIVGAVAGAFLLGPVGVVIGLLIAALIMKK